MIAWWIVVIIAVVSYIVGEVVVVSNLRKRLGASEFERMVRLVKMYNDEEQLKRQVAKSARDLKRRV